ncbi:unnamed protein product [Zymoseptoria tritici ST99CH_3D7]|uniref:Major facilitator superfamily (MFS) profile domain-containing protein n=1 Tax=Zymoseptoria tritici (strain ST99CH_3D7) TaxID=1276538 RepID=A0A1X7RWM1_ZYMT9|nr:unnamed protein product [Zymoseptoria tritici ST99CH_3D7]
MESTKWSFSSFRSPTAFIAFTVTFAVFTDQFLFAAILPIGPFTLHERLHIPEDKVQFWIAILLAVFGIGCFVTAGPWGWYTDRSTSRRTPFLIGLSILLGATLVLWFSQHIALQILGRALQGFSSLVVWATGLAVLVDTVGCKHIGEYMGYIGIALNMGSLVAPMVGGVVFAQAGYNAVFGVVTAVVGLDILFRLIMKEKTPSETTSVAPLQDDLESGSPDIKEKEKTVVTIETISQSSSPSTSTLDLTTTTPSRRHLPPVIRLLNSLRFCVAIWGVFVISCVFSAFQAVLPMAVKTVFGWNSTGSGLIFLPLSLPALLGPIVGRMTDRYGGRWFATAGFVLLGIAVTMLRAVEYNSRSQQVLLCVLLFLCGCCMTLVLEPLAAEVTHGAARLDAKDKEMGIESAGSYGQSYALFNMAWAAGNSTGPVWGGILLDAAGWNAMALSLGLLGFLSAVPVALCLDGWMFEKKF